MAVADTSFIGGTDLSSCVRARNAPFSNLPFAAVESYFSSQSIIPPQHTFPFTSLSVSAWGMQVQVFGSPQVFRAQQLAPVESRGSTFVNNNYGCLPSVSQCLILHLLIESFANARYGCSPCCCCHCLQGVAGFPTW